MSLLRFLGRPTDRREGLNEGIEIAAENSAGGGSVVNSLAKIAATVENEFRILGRRGLAVCSPSSATGTTFTAVQVAVSLANSGVRVLLVDTNLRAPSIAGMFGVSGETPGLAAYLGSPESGDGPTVLETEIPTLFILPTERADANAQELLASARFRGTVSTLMRRFDYTIFDTSAGNRSSDACVVASLVGYALIVARRSVSYVDDVAIMSEELEKAGARIVGSVLNGV